MKVYYNKKSFLINQDNISAYNLLQQSLEKINEQQSQQYYLTSVEGFPLKHDTLCKKSETYHLKKRMTGANNLYQKGNSAIITVVGGVLFGILSVYYYGAYLEKIVKQVPMELDGKLFSQYAKNSTKEIEMTTMAGGSFLQTLKSGAIKAADKTKSGLALVFDKIADNTADSSFAICLCNQLQVCPFFTIRKQQTSPSAIISATLFTTFIVSTIVPLICNASTTISCGHPGYSKLTIPILFILVPLVLMFASPKIIEGIDWLLKKLKFSPVLSNHKLAITNVLLMVAMFIYFGLNHAGMSSIMYVMIIFVGIPLFAGFYFLLPYLGLDKLCSLGLSEDAMSSGQTCNAKLTPDYQPNFKKARDLPEPECVTTSILYGTRYNFIVFILMSFIGFGFLTAVFAAQIRKSCPI